MSGNSTGREPVCTVDAVTGGTPDVSTVQQDPEEVKLYRSKTAKNNVAAFAQNQALSALFSLYREVLCQNSGLVDDRP